MVRVYASRSFISLGEMDLELREPLIEPDLDEFVEQCEHCGYCSGSIAEGGPLAKSLVRTTHYLGLLEDRRFSLLARQLRAHSYLEDAEGNASEAIDAQRRAAWACDDGPSRTRSAAKICRLEVLRLLQMLHAKGETYGEEPLVDQVLRIDLFRRSQQFVAADALASGLLHADLSEDLRRMIILGQQKAIARDAGRYSVSGAAIAPGG